ncbi:uncharacterized protein PV09_05986 [Verruconis gallopava]|uniref:Jacalin-type lectin domain-containing protein n=1 Tax=Verruconis gallopava TaxID=253628 RepID=A0A0D2A8P8_9PEZI|nr:uncharacterized protein PV09_05986 [Verruconis gallopava]KIW02940.1 hypothetical protein PV09_05986 [Verruconis gallopava]
MPSLSKAWRRISHSQPSPRTKAGSEESSNASIRSKHANKSTNTLDTASADSNSTTPPTSVSNPDLSAGASEATLTPRRPPMTANGTNRYSVLSSNGFPQARVSPLAPIITSISDGSATHQKVLLVRGQIGSLEALGDLHLSSSHPHRTYNGLVHIFSHQGSFPVYSVPVVESRFKALIHLQAGRNTLRFEFEKARSSHGVLPGEHVSWLNLNYIPLNASPPLHLAILVAADSEEKFDAPPHRVAAEGNDLEVAKRKYRMAAYLWQAYTADQMQRNGFLSRCFRLEEEWQPSTLGGFEDPQPWRSEARIHVIRLKQTVAELRNPEYAQQNPNAKESGKLFEIAMQACKEHFKCVPNGQKQYVSAMFLDSHWDPNLNLLTGHAALGGGDGESLQLAIFGSHLLYSYPMCIQHVIPAFNDCTPTDTRYVCNDCGDCGSSWEAANVGIGAHMHEVGHLFGLPHRPSGVMMRDYVKLNRTFTVGEPFSTRTRSPGKKFLPREEECAWSRLDCLRFRYHPCFRHTTDRYTPVEGGIQVWGIADEVTATSDAGIAWVEIYADDDEMCYAWKEYLPRRPMQGSESPRSDQCPRTVRLVEAELREHLKQQLPANKKKFSKIRLQICSTTNVQLTIDDLGKLTDKSSLVKIPNGQKAYRSGKLGLGAMEGSKPQELVLESAYLKVKEKDILGNEVVKAKVVRSVRVYHGLALDGIEFCHEDGTSQLFGSRGGKPGGDEFVLDTRIGETIAGFYVRAGAWIDAIQIITTMTGRKSPIYGNPTGGSGHTLIPPNGYRVMGIAGSCGQWVDSFQLIIGR